jgi:hypothetical protein
MAKQWQKSQLQLKANHNWRATPGYKIFVADRGAIKLDYPQKWIVKPAEDCIKFHDAEPPDDNCVLAVSYLRLPPDIDWRELPLAHLLADVVNDDRRNLQHDGRVFKLNRQDIEVAWTESDFIDPVENRAAVACIGLARGYNLQSLLTCDYWADQRQVFRPVWLNVLRSVQLGLTIKDPTVGQVLH